MAEINEDKQTVFLAPLWIKFFTSITKKTEVKTKLVVMMKKFFQGKKKERKKERKIERKKEIKKERKKERKKEWKKLK